MKGNFEKCLRETFSYEGGFTNDPNDRGGATKLGITAGTLAGAYKAGIVKCNDITKLTSNEAKEIYRINYWNRMKCDELPDKIDFLVFDMGVNSGIGTSGKLLQNAINRFYAFKIAEDGGIGAQTIKAINLLISEELPEIFSHDAILNGLIDALLENFETYYNNITDGVNSTQAGKEQEIKNRNFLRGWISRNVKRSVIVGS